MPRHLPLATPRAVVSSSEGAAMPYRGPLDWLNFLLADVKGALGPYIGIYLLTEQHWNQAQIGFLATVAGIVGLIIHAPLGAFIDATHWKRTAVVAGVGVLTISALSIAIMPSFPVVLTARRHGRSKIRILRTVRDHLQFMLALRVGLWRRSRRRVLARHHDGEKLPAVP